MVFQKFQFTNYMYTRTDGIALNEQILLVPGPTLARSRSSLFVTKSTATGLFEFIFAPVTNSSQC